jgi:uncharacterized protein (DUF934 family)
MPVLNIAVGSDPAPTNDNWVRLADGAAPNATDRVIVPFARLKGGDNQIFGAAAVGVEMGGADQVEDLKPWIDRLGIVVLRFATFKDGRLFTSARMLRQRLGFKGDVRAAGDFLPDQTAFLLRTGVSSLEVSDTFPVDAAARSARAYSVRYQHAADSQTVAYDERHAP